MRILIRTVMFLACLVYGVMPCMAAPDTSVSAAKMHTGEETAHFHADHMVMAISGNDKAAPCPHKNCMGHGGICAACLVLLPISCIADAGPAHRFTSVPERQAAFVGVIPVPLLPPPRL